jgi:flagellin-like hook-associated protein FlgL
MDYRRMLSRIDQLQLNVGAAINWQQVYDTVMQDTKNLVSEANELAIAMSNESYDAGARAASAEEIGAIFNRMLSLANTEERGKSVFSGYRTDEPAFSGSQAGAVFNGDNGTIAIEVQDGLDMQVNQIGSDVFLKQINELGTDADYNPAMIGATLLADLNRGAGVDLVTGATPGVITITDENLGVTSTIDFNTAPAVTTVQDVLDRINAQLAADGITELTASIGPAGGQILLEATPSGLVSTSTRLDVLHEGRGVDMSPGSIRLSDGVNPDIVIDLAGALDLDDIITKFNAQAPAGVTMQVDPVGEKGLRIVDANGVPLGLEVQEYAPADSTALDLGILGLIDPTLTGADLSPAVSMTVADTTGTTGADLGIVASFTNSHIGSDLDPTLIATDAIAVLNSGSGLDLGEITITQGVFVRTINLGAPTIVTVQDMLDAINGSGLTLTASINAAGSGIEIVNDDPTRTFTIEDTEPGGSITKNLEIYGSTDMMGSLLVLQRAMINDDGDGIRHLVGNMEAAINHTIAGRAGVGARWGQLESIRARHSKTAFRFTGLLAETEDADLTKMITDLATYENNFQVSLAAAAAIIQPTLMDFLR